MKILTKIINKIRKHKILFTFSLIYVYSAIDNRSYNKLLPYYLRMKNCQKELYQRFHFSGKLENNYLNPYSKHLKPTYEVNKVYPTNTFDTQKILEIATDYHIPIINDFCYKNLRNSEEDYNKNKENENSRRDFNLEENPMSFEIFGGLYDIWEYIKLKLNNNKEKPEEEDYLNFDHIKIDFSKFNKILKFNKSKNLICLEPGVKIKEILDYLKPHGLTISELEEYKFSELTISDIIYNNYYSFINGKFIDEKIDEITVVVPNKQDALKLKQTNDFILSCANLKNIFLRSNSIFGLINEFKFKTEPIKEFSYITLQPINNSFNDSIEFIKELEDLKKNSLVKDFIISKTGNFINIFLKIKEKKIEKLKKFFESENLSLDKVSSDEFLQYKLKNFGILSSEEKVFRKIKIRVDKNCIIDVLKKIIKVADEHKTDISYHFNLSEDCIDIKVFSDHDDLTSLENSIYFIQRTQSIADKNCGNIFRKSIFK